MYSCLLPLSLTVSVCLSVCLSSLCLSPPPPSPPSLCLCLSPLSSLSLRQTVVWTSLSKFVQYFTSVHHWRFGVGWGRWGVLVRGDRPEIEHDTICFFLFFSSWLLVAMWWDLLDMCLCLVWFIFPFWQWPVTCLRSLSLYIHNCYRFCILYHSMVFSLTSAHLSLLLFKFWLCYFNTFCTWCG